MSKACTHATRRLSAKVPAEVHDRLNQAASNRGMTMTRLLWRQIEGLNPNYRPVGVESIANRQPYKPPSRFSKADQALVIKEKAGGLTIYQIAALWKCNKSTVARIVNRQKTFSYPLHPERTKPLPVTVSDCESLRRLRKSNPMGWSYAKLGERFGVSARTAARIFKRKGVYARYGQPK